MLKYNKQKIFITVATAATLTLSGCSWFSANNDGREDIDEAYLKSRQSVDLQIPEEVTEIKEDDSYQIPEGVAITGRAPKGQELGLEPPQLLLSSGDGVREDKDAAHPTVWLRGESSQLGSYIDGFVSSNNIKFESKDNHNLVTEWLRDDDDGIGEGLGSYNIDDQRHKFELSMVSESQHEFGVQVIHLASQQKMDGEWVSVETSERVAKQFLNQFIGYYDGIRDREARARILAEGVVETRLGTNSQGHIAMVSDRDLQSVWQQTSAVLEFLNLPIVDRDQSQGIFYFKVEDPEGFWSSIFGDNNNAKIKLQPGSYRLVLEAMADGVTSISFEDESGDRLPPNLVGAIYPEFKAAYRGRKK